MVQSTTGQSLSDIAREIKIDFRTKPALNAPRTSNPSIVRSPATMPEYVEHRDGATEIGKLSAEAVVREYEAAAKEIEAMGAELVERVKQCEAMSRDVLR